MPLATYSLQPYRPTPARTYTNLHNPLTVKTYELTYDYTYDPTLATHAPHNLLTDLWKDSPTIQLSQGDHLLLTSFLPSYQLCNLLPPTSVSLQIAYLPPSPLRPSNSTVQSLSQCTPGTNSQPTPTHNPTI